MKINYAAEMKEAEKIARGLIAIAKLAMPDSYFASDSRVRRARRFLDRAKSRCQAKR